MAKLKAQDKDLIYALDIGTRSIVGVVGRPVDDRFKVLDIELAEHGKRCMMDGQIDDIEQVAGLARKITKRLEERLGVQLKRVCVAAAGRALRTQSGTFSLEPASDQPIDAEFISRLEAGAVSVAEEALQADEEARRQFFLVGYTVAQYRLDNYPLSTLLYHNGGKADVDVVATFLPGEVVESLYASMHATGLQVASMTLEPIAAVNAAIPAELRLLNLALVDIGAGTTDIALCKEGSVVGYTMITVAGDEVTETLMKAFLVDFATAERMKRELKGSSEITYMDILGLENSVSVQEVEAVIQEPMERLAGAIAKQIIEINGGPPSALFLAGGGSKLNGLREKVARSLEMDEKRVAIAGKNFAKTAFSDDHDLDNPEYATPLGIAVSAGMGLLNDSYVVLLNGTPAKLFRNGVLTLRDILLMNGYTYNDMLGRTGKVVSITLDGRHVMLRGEPPVPAILRINGADAALSAVVHAGDRVDFVPARHGTDGSKSLKDLLGADFVGEVLVNNQRASMNTLLRQGDVVLTLKKAAPLPLDESELLEDLPPEAKKDEPEPALTTEAPQSSPREVRFLLNDKPLILPRKEDGSPYFLMDLLQYSGIDFERLDRPVRLEVNGVERGFQYSLKDSDSVVIRTV